MKNFLVTLRMSIMNTIKKSDAYEFSSGCVQHITDYYGNSSSVNN